MAFPSLESSFPDSLSIDPLGEEMRLGQESKNKSKMVPVRTHYSREGERQCREEGKRGEDRGKREGSGREVGRESEEGRNEEGEKEV